MGFITCSVQRESTISIPKKFREPRPNQTLIQGKITGPAYSKPLKNIEVIPFATVVFKVAGKEIRETNSDFDGFYELDLTKYKRYLRLS